MLSYIYVEIETKRKQLFLLVFVVDVCHDAVMRRKAEKTFKILLVRVRCTFMVRESSSSSSSKLRAWIFLDRNGLGMAMVNSLFYDWLLYNVVRYLQGCLRL